MSTSPSSSGRKRRRDEDDSDGASSASSSDDDASAPNRSMGPGQDAPDSSPGVIRRRTDQRRGGNARRGPAALQNDLDRLGDDEDDGEELVDEGIEQDYRAMPVLDTYEGRGLGVKI